MLPRSFSIPHSTFSIKARAAASASLLAMFPLPAFAAGAPPPVDIPAIQLDPKLLDIKPAQKPKSDKWRFTLLPVGLHKNPQIDYAVITEMTPAGKKLPPPAFDRPVYYISHSMGQSDLGDPYGGMKRIPYSQLEKLLGAALASNGYRPADPATPPPTQLLFITWGMLNKIDLHGGCEENSDNSSGDGIGVDTIENLLARAKVVGGRKFAGEFAQALSYTINDRSPGAFLRFSERDPTTETLVFAVRNECYYLLVTSLDVEALKLNKRKVLWTTRISTISPGVAFATTLPIMIDNASYFFGRETAPEILRKRAYKKATVELGEMTVVDDNTSRSAKPSPTGATAPSGTTTGNP